MRPVNDILMHEGGAAVAGAGLRVAWSRGPMLGYIGTAGVVIGGLLADQFMRGSPSTRRALEGIAAGGAAIAGWVAAEKVFYKGGSAPIPAHVLARYKEAIASGRLRALSAGPEAGAPFPVNDPLLARNY